MKFVRMKMSHRNHQHKRPLTVFIIYCSLSTRIQTITVVCFGIFPAKFKRKFPELFEEQFKRYKASLVEGEGGSRSGGKPFLYLKELMPTCKRGRKQHYTPCDMNPKLLFLQYFNILIKILEN